MPNNKRRKVEHLSSSHRRYGDEQRQFSQAWRSMSGATRSYFMNDYNFFRACLSFGAQRTLESAESPEGVVSDSAVSDADTAAASGSNEQSPYHADPDASDALREYFGNWNPDSPATGSLPDMADIQNNVPGPRGASSTANTSTAQNMETEDIGSGGGGPGGVSGSTSEPAALSRIPPIIGLKKLHMIFTKKFLRYTYGLAHKQIAGATGSLVDRYTTPYAYIPVDWLPWYLSPAEYTSIPACSRVAMVNCRVTMLGTRTSFDHGTTLSGTATTEYVPIVKHCIGLNNKVYLENRAVELNTSEPMQVLKFKEKALTALYYNLYESYPAAHEVPRHHNFYASYLYNQTPTTQPPTVNPNDTISDHGLYRTDKLLHTALVNKNLGVPIIDYTYKPKTGFLKPSKRAVKISYGEASSFPNDISASNIPYDHTVPSYLTLKDPQGKTNGNSRLTGSTASFAHNFAVRVEGDYFQQLETYVYINPSGGSTSNFRNQPQVHIGLLATPQLNPAVEAESFLNSCLYLLCENECVVEFDLDSMCTSGENYSWPDGVRFFMDRKHDYNGYGYHNFGIAATVKGRLEGTSSGIFEVSDDNDGMSDEFSLTSNVNRISLKPKKRLDKKKSKKKSKLTPSDEELYCGETISDLTSSD